MDFVARFLSKQLELEQQIDMLFRRLLLIEERLENIDTIQNYRELTPELPTPE